MSYFVEIWHIFESVCNLLHCFKWAVIVYYFFKPIVVMSWICNFACEYPFKNCSNYLGCKCYQCKNSHKSNDFSRHLFRGKNVVASFLQASFYFSLALNLWGLMGPVYLVASTHPGNQDAVWKVNWTHGPMKIRV